MDVNEQHRRFDKWLHTICFQPPTPEAYDLAWCAWKEAERGVQRIGFWAWGKHKFHVLYARYLWWRA